MKYQLINCRIFHYRVDWSYTRPIPNWLNLQSYFGRRWSFWSIWAESLDKCNRHSWLNKWNFVPRPEQWSAGNRCRSNTGNRIGSRCCRDRRWLDGTGRRRSWGRTLRREWSLSGKGVGIESEVAQGIGTVLPFGFAILNYF